MKKCLLEESLLQIIIRRLCEEAIENHQQFADSVLVGLQPRGVLFAERVRKGLVGLLGKEMAMGCLDTTFHRDDLRHQAEPLLAHRTQIDFSLENKRVLLIDDVLFTGRSVRAAMDAIIDYGRPLQLELMVLIDRMYYREFPIAPTYVGRRVNTLKHERVQILWKGKGQKKDVIWLHDNKKVQQ